MEDDPQYKHVLAIFETFDKNGDGVLDAAELSECLKALGLGPNYVTKFLQSIDKDGDNEARLHVGAVIHHLLRSCSSMCGPAWSSMRQNWKPCGWRSAACAAMATPARPSPICMSHCVARSACARAACVARSWPMAHRLADSAPRSARAAPEGTTGRGHTRASYLHVSDGVFVRRHAAPRPQALHDTTSRRFARPSVESPPSSRRRSCLPHGLRSQLSH